MIKTIFLFKETKVIRLLSVPSEFEFSWNPAFKGTMLPLYVELISHRNLQVSMSMWYWLKTCPSLKKLFGGDNKTFGFYPVKNSFFCTNQILVWPTKVLTHSLVQKILRYWTVLFKWSLVQSIFCLIEYQTNTNTFEPLDCMRKTMSFDTPIIQHVPTIVESSFLLLVRKRRVQNLNLWSLW